MGGFDFETVEKTESVIGHIGNQIGNGDLLPLQQRLSTGLQYWERLAASSFVEAADVAIVEP